MFKFPRDVIVQINCVGEGRLLFEEVTKLPEVEWAHGVTGKADILTKLSYEVTHDNDLMKQIKKSVEKLRMNPKLEELNIEDTTTSVVFWNYCDRIPKGDFAYIGVYCTGYLPDQPYEQLIRKDEVFEAYALLGKPDILLGVTISDSEDFLGELINFIIDDVRTQKGVKDTTTFLVLSGMSYFKDLNR